MKKQNNKLSRQLAKGALPLLAMLGGSAVASARNHSAVNSASRRFLRTSAVAVSDKAIDDLKGQQNQMENLTRSEKRSVFAAFGHSSTKKVPVAKAEIDEQLLTFLTANNLLQPERNANASLSGDLSVWDSQKTFLQCTYSSSVLLDKTACESGGYIWIGDTPANTDPSFNSGASITLTVLEDASATSINELLKVADSDSGQTLTWSVSSAPGKGSLSGFPKTASSGSASITPAGLTYTPAANQNGSDSFEISVSDGQGGTSDTITVNVTITPVNDQPSISIAANQSNSGSDGGVQQTVSNFASMSSPGGASDESGQTAASFIVSEASDANNVVSGVAIDNSGNLTYTPASGVQGTATINAQVQDSGGTANSGIDTSSVSQFTITVDTLAPTITGISIPNTLHKVGDVVTVTINVSGDSDDYTTGSGGISGTIDGYALGSLSKINDTTYTATFTVTDGGNDVAAGSSVPLSFTLTDSAGNSSSAFTTAISQSSDAIYANLPEISLTADTNSIAEDGGVSTLTATISGSLNNQWPENITANLAYTGTGSAGTDYSKFDSITITAGNSTGTAALTGMADTLFDAAADETAIVDISSLSVGTEGATNQQTITINDAQSTPTVTLSTANSSVAENAGTSTITAALNNATYADVTVNLAYTGTAIGGTDYNTASSAITIPAGSTSASAVTGITAVDDAVLEGDETIIIDITSVSGGSAAENGSQQKTITISDDEDGTAPVISAVSIPNSVHKVGDTVTATITVSSDSDDYTTGSGGISGTIDGYALGSLSKINDTTYTATFTVTDGGNDVAAGSSVPLSFTLTDSAGNSSSAFTTAISQSSDAIYANLPEISLTADTNSIAEDGGVSTLTATISGSLNNQWPENITANLAYTGTGSAGTDYSKFDSITITAGNSTGTAALTGMADTLFDAAADETAIVDISSLSVGTEGATNQQTITINDAQSTPTVTLSTANSSVAENAGTSTITAALNNATYADVTVNLAYTGTAIGGTDYNTASSAITIPAGSTSASAVTGITAVDDAVLEDDETIIIDITSVSGGSAAKNGSQQKTITISDDDSASVSLSVSSSSIAEAAGSTVITATLDKVTIADVSVDLGFAGTAGELDYTKTASTITIPAGQTQGSVSVTSSADAIVEPDETIIVAITNVSGGSANENGVQQQTITIKSAPTPMLASATYDASTGYLVVTGINFESRPGEANDVDISLLTLTGKGADSYTLTSTSDVDVDSATQFTVLLSAEDKKEVDKILDKTGASASDAQLYNLAAADDFMGNTSNEDTSDPLGNGITVSKVAPVVTAPASAVILNSESQTVSGSYSTDDISISLYLDADNDGLSDGGDALGSAVVTDGLWSIDVALADDTVYNTVVIADFAGGQQSAPVDVATITEDSTAPVDPIVITPAAAVNESGSSYIISGSHVENGAIVKLYRDSDNDGVADNATALASTAVTGNAWSFTTPIAAGANNFIVLAEDAAANRSNSIAIAAITGNTAPVIAQGSAIGLNIDEDTLGQISLNASDAENDTLIWSISSPAANGLATASGSGNSKVISYLPNANFNGSDSFTVAVTDNTEVASIVVNVGVASRNDLPIFTSAAVTAATEDKVYSYSIIVSDSDDINLVITASTKPAWLTLVDNGNGSAVLSGSPANMDVGEHNIVLAVHDDESGTDTQSFIVTVSNTNDAPLIFGSPATSVNEDAPYSFTPTVTDDDAGDSKTFSIVNQPGWANFNSATGALTGTPTNADIGTSSNIVITVTDSGNAAASLKAFNITVSNVNDAPLISGSPATSVNEDVPYSFTPTVTDDDAGDSKIFSIVNQPGWANFNSATGTLTGTPTNADVGTSSNIIITVTDSGNAAASLKAFNITVANVNDAPEISGSPVVKIAQDQAYNFKAAATDIDQDDLTYSIQNLPAWAEFNTATGVLSGTPLREHIGIFAGIVISVSDGIASAALPAFSIEVTKVNQAPVAESGHVAVNEDSSLAIELAASDVHQDQLTYLIENKPEHGTLVQQGEQWLYTPEADFNGTDTFTFKANDGEVDSNSATVNIDVLPVNDKPFAEDDLFTLATNGDNRYQIDVLANDSDVDGDALTIIGVSASVGEVVVENGKLLFQAPAGTAGKVEFNYVIQDPSLASATAKASLLLQSVKDDNLPELTLPADIVADATGLFTKLDVGTASAVDASGEAIPVSIVSGDTLFPPGNSTVHWQAVDGEGHAIILSQKVKVNPLISIAKDGQTVEGSEVVIAVHLNGEAPDYPVSIAYSVSGSADAGDHNLSDGELVIEQGTTGFIPLTIYEDGQAEGDETIEVHLSSANNLGNKSVHTLTIVEQNVAPIVELQVSQAGEQRYLVTNNNDPVTISALISDANPADGHSIVWSTEHNELVDISAEQNEFIFNPSALLPGVYRLTATVTDDAVEPLTTTQKVYIEVTAALAELGDEDSDGDLIPDNQEGFNDSDHDGIPNYLDAINECNVLQERVQHSDRFLVEGDPGVCLRKGLTVAGNQTGGAQLLEHELLADDAMSNVGGVFDFVATGLAIPGQNYSIVIPQQLPVPQGAIYRKLKNNQWVNFVEDANNILSSAAGEPGYCPPPNDEKWTPGLTAGDWCVQLTIQDGGANDDDGLVNASIVDPGGVAVMSNNNQQPVANPDAVSVKWKKSIVIDVLANDTDADNDPLEIAVATVDFGLLAFENSQLVYTTSDIFYDKATIQYSITDNKGGAANSSVTVQVVNNFAPVANEDRAATDDQTALKIAVLSNDQDADGDLLTVTQAAAEYGDVVINADQTLTYTAQQGFSGVDTISYSIRDEKSATAQGKVIVTVKAYVTAEVENSSGGAMGSFALLLLGGVALLRRYKRVALLLTMATISCHLSANTQADSVSGLKKWSIEAQLGYATAHNNNALSDIPAAQVKQVDDSGGAWSIGVAYQLTPKWKLAGRYIDLGQGSATLNAETLNPQEYHQAVAKATPVLGHGLAADLSYQLFNVRNIFANGSLGLFNWKSELESTYQNASIKHEESGTDPYAGMQVGYQFNRHWQLGVGYSRYFISQNDVDSISLQLSYRL